MSDVERYITVAKVALLFAVSPKTVTRWAREGKLPYARTLGGQRRYPERFMRDLAASYTSATTTTTTTTRQGTR